MSANIAPSSGSRGDFRTLGRRSPAEAPTTVPSHARRDGLRERLTSSLVGLLMRSPRKLFAERPLVTFSFDGASRTSYLLGAALVERAAARAIFYIGTSHLGESGRPFRMMEPDDIRDLQQRGHELGLYGHRSAILSQLGPEGMANDIRRNRQVLAEIHPGIAAPNFAYPFALTSLTQKATVSALAQSSRGRSSGVNFSGFDCQWLRSVELDESLGRNALESYLNRTDRGRGWIIFSIRDVSDPPGSRGCSPSLLKATLDACVNRGFEIVTVAQAMAKTQPTRTRDALTGTPEPGASTPPRPDGAGGARANRLDSPVGTL